MSVNRSRFGIRAMIAGVAVAAIVCAALFVWLPPVLRRLRIDQIVREQYDAYIPLGDMPRTPVPTYAEVKRRDVRDYDLLKSDPEAAASRLLRAAAAGGADYPEGGKRPDEVAILHLGEWLTEVDSVALAMRSRDRLFELAVGGTLDVGVEWAAIAQVGKLCDRLGLDDARRARARDRLRIVAAKPSALLYYAWTDFVGTIGGREEIDLLFELLKDGRPDRINYFAANSSFGQTRWPGMIARLQPLLANPKLANWIEFPVMLGCLEGRRLLLELAEDATRSLPLRRHCVHQLKRDMEGLSLLLTVCDDPARRAKIAPLFGEEGGGLVGIYGGCEIDAKKLPTYPYAKTAADPADPRPEMRRLRDDYHLDRRPWRAFERVFQREKYAGAPGLFMFDPHDAPSRADVDRTIWRIEFLAPETHPRTTQGWIDWLASADRPPITWASWLSAYERTPDDDETLDFPDSRLTLPADAVAVLVRIAHARPTAFRAMPAQALLLKAERTEEAGLLIEVMAERIKAEPNKLSARDPELLRTLRHRFAVNLGWDIEAWRAWWAEERGRIVPF